MLLLVFALAAPGCSPGADEASRAAAEAEAAAAREKAAAPPDTTRPAFADAAPGELQLPTPVRRAVRQPLEWWTLAWHSALPTLRLDQFARAGVVSFAGVDEGPFSGNLEGEDLRLQHLVVTSPDARLLLDPWLDLELVGGAEGEAVRVVRGLEPGVGLVDLGRQSERRLFDLPGGSRVDGAFWIDDRRVIVVTDEPARGGRRPGLHLVDVAAETDTRYLGPVADAADARQARAELDRRFIAARPALAMASRP
jgi:hypothetical protein